MTTARMVRHEPTGPHRNEAQDKPVFICGCGPTQNQPHRDGSHAACRNEQQGRLYIYDAGRRKVAEVAAMRRDVISPNGLHLRAGTGYGVSASLAEADKAPLGPFFFIN